MTVLYDKIKSALSKFVQLLFSIDVVLFVRFLFGFYMKIGSRKYFHIATKIWIVTLTIFRVYFQCRNFMNYPSYALILHDFTCTVELVILCIISSLGGEQHFYTYCSEMAELIDNRKNKRASYFTTSILLIGFIILIVPTSISCKKISNALSMLFLNIFNYVACFMHHLTIIYVFELLWREIRKCRISLERLEIMSVDDKIMKIENFLDSYKRSLDSLNKANGVMIPTVSIYFTYMKPTKLKK